MANLGTVLKEEISRLSRKAVRGQVDGMKKATTQHRHHIASLKRQVAQLEREIAALARRVGNGAARDESAATARPVRFVAKGLRSHRTRLGLSASEFGKLAGVSAQTVYNWEREVAHPGKEQLARLAALRGIGKREAGRRLEALGPAKTARKSA